MLAAIRDKASGWIAGIIVGALIISFAFWGMSSYFGGGDINVAIVNGSEINYQSFQRSFYRLRQQMQSVLGDDALSLEEEQFIKEQTLQQLVNEELVNQIIKENRLRVTNKTVVEKIKDLEYFKGEKGFDRTKYERAISSMGMDPLYFEAQFRMDLLSEQLQAGLSDSLFVLNSELESVLRLKLQTRDLAYTTLTLESFINEAEAIEDAEIESFYKANSSDFTIPEKVKIAYLELNVSDLAEGIETDEKSLREYYDNNKDSYDVVEQRSITKLFVNFTEKYADKNVNEVVEKKKAKAIIESALVMIKEGKTFEEVIEEFTKEGKGALQFSEVAFITRGIQEKEIDEFLFAANENEVSDIIETKTALNIVKVGQIRGGPKNVYETVAEQIEHDYKQSQAEMQFFELSDQLTNLSYEHPYTLEIAAEAIDKVIVETDFFSRNGESEGLLSKPQIISTSFNDELISSGQNSEIIELSNNHIVVLKVLEHRVAKPNALKNVRDEVILAIKLKRATEKISEVSKEIVKQLELGISTDEIETDVKLEWISIDKTKRDNVAVNRSVLRNAFQAGIPAANPIVSSNRLGSGDYSIIIVKAVHNEAIDGSENVEKLSKSIDLEMRRTRGRNEWRQFIKNAKNNSDIILFKENI